MSGANVSQDSRGREAESPDSPAPAWLAKQDFQSLLDELAERGFEVVGPTVDQEAIVYDRIRSIDDLPRGWGDVQEPGKYRLVRRDDDAWFGYVIGPQSWKKYLFLPHETLLRSERTSTGWRMETPEPASRKVAILGARACEVAAIAIQDRVFAGGAYVDPHYVARRRNLFVIAVQCAQAASTCFCTSMGTGPECRQGFDLALTELPDGFVVSVGSDSGRDLLAAAPTREATDAERRSAAERRGEAVRQIERRFDTHDLRGLLQANLEHPRWADVANRCLSCANCTMVCPTCFCSSVEEVTDLTGDVATRERRWDSCFNQDLAYSNGASDRPTIRSRYRQWLTHKLSTWHDQFEQSGCTGCGRCITWCPVGIDLTAEVDAIRRTSATGTQTTPSGRETPR